MTAEVRASGAQAAGILERHAVLDPPFSRIPGSGQSGVADLVLERVRLRARRRIAWLRTLWLQEGVPGGADLVTHAEIDTHLDDLDSPEAEVKWVEDSPQLRLTNERLFAVEAELAANSRSTLSRLATVLGLDARETDVIQACWALALDGTLARVFAYMQDHTGRPYVTDRLVQRLFGHGRRPAISTDSPLLRWELVSEQQIEPGSEPVIALDPTIRDWLAGREPVDPVLAAVAREVFPRDPLPGWPLDRALTAVRRALEGRPGQPVRVKLSGQPGSGRRTFAAAVASALGLRTIAVNADLVGDSDWARVYLRAMRHAHLSDVTVVWHGESCFRRQWPGQVRPCRIQFVAAEPGQALVGAPGLLDISGELPDLSAEERRSLWLKLVPGASRWPPDSVERLATGHRAVVGEIATTGLGCPETPVEASAMVRSAGRERVGSLAQRMETPFTIDDLIVSEALRGALRDYIYEARTRVEFWERPDARRLFPQGRGLLALFSGLPGTGKTMAAQVVAASLRLDLYRVDLSAVVSKYVGETSQNLERVLSRTSHMDVVLLFDEADALFGRRTEIKDAHDRFANTDTNYLLQAIESYQGIGVLATNRKGNIDPAFIRRLRYVMEFQRPDAQQRLAIWRRIVRELAGDDRERALLADLRMLSDDVEATGAQIKFALLTALFASRREEKPLVLDHLVRGLDRELAKSGRAFSDRERERLLNRG